MHVAVGGFQHETNTFAPTQATLEDFVAPDAWPKLLRGEELEPGCSGINLPIAGFFGAARQDNLKIKPLLWCSASPSAHVREDAFEKISEMLLTDLEAVVREIDAVYLDLHGAMVCEHFDDGDGEILRRVRALAGDIPIIASLDLHANVTEAMFEYADGLLIYRTYPHVDMSATGARAARFLARCCADGRLPAKAMKKIDFLVPLPWQCTDMEPARGLYAITAKQSEADTPAGRIHDLSLAMGFPLADIAECGPAVVAYGDSQEVATTVCDDLAEKIYAAENDFQGPLFSPVEALNYVAEKRDQGVSGPFVLADSQDNPGAGANSDTVGLLKAMLDHKGGLHCAIGVIFDPEEAKRIVDALGENGKGEMHLSLGAKTGAASEEKPVVEVFHVETCSASVKVRAQGPFFGGALLCWGASALIRRGDVYVVVGSCKIQCADRAVFAHFGLDLNEFDVIAVKSSVHFRADFDPIARETLVVVSPAPAFVDLAQLPWRKLRPGVRPMPGG